MWPLKTKRGRHGLDVTEGEEDSDRKFLEQTFRIKPEHRKKIHTFIRVQRLML